MLTHSPQQRPTWEEFATHLRSPAPVLVRLRGEPPVDLFVEASGSRLGLRVATSDLTADVLSDAPLASLQIATVRLGGGDHLEIATTASELFPYFFAFALSIADRIQLDGATPAAALRRSLRDWRALLERVALLTPEHQLGLLGELWLLDRLIDVYGAAALDAWTGPKGEAHDFRAGTYEFEVKTTKGEHRRHLISSDSQLVASPGHELYLLSVQFAAGGTPGRSLRDAIEALQSRCARLRAEAKFARALEAAFHLTPATWRDYTVRMQLRTPPLLVPITDSFPRITLSDVLAIPRAEMMRVSDLRYRVDVDGLGWEDGTPEFLAVLPRNHL